MITSGNFIDTNGAFTTFTVPGAFNSFTYGINDLGQVVGDYQLPSIVVAGFVDTNGSLDSVSVPGSNYTVITAINDSGQIVGIYYDDQEVYHSFIGTPIVPVPESASASVITLAVLATAAWHSRRRRDAAPRPTRAATPRLIDQLPGVVRQREA